MQQQKEISVTINDFSQPHVLRHRMLENQLTHGQTVTADLSPVRVEPGHYGEPVMYFCPMRTVDVKQQLEFGDGGHIPHEVTLKGIKLPAHLRPGLYNLKNVMLHSNGTMQVIATEQTVFEPYEQVNQYGRDSFRHQIQPEMMRHDIRTLDEQRELELRRRMDRVEFEPSKTLPF